MKNKIKLILGVLFIAIFFSPLYLPLLYESNRLYYYPYEIIIWILSLFILGFIFMRLDIKQNEK